MSVYRVHFVDGQIPGAPELSNIPSGRTYYDKIAPGIVDGKWTLAERFTIYLEAGDESEAIELARTELELARLIHTFS
jgi:hypothetical protein